LPKSRGDRFIEFENEQNVSIVLERDKADKEFDRILNTYRILFDRSEDLRDKRMD